MTALLPQLDADGYKTLLAEAEGIGNHASDEGATVPDGKPAHDHSTHSHGSSKKQATRNFRRYTIISTRVSQETVPHRAYKMARARTIIASARA
jgi:hypothetical protein